MSDLDREAKTYQIVFETPLWLGLGVMAAAVAVVALVLWRLWKRFNAPRP